MATKTALKTVYFPEIPDYQPLLNSSDTEYIDGSNIQPGSINYDSLTQSLAEGENTLYGFEALKSIVPYGETGVDANAGRRNTVVGYQTGLSMVYGHDNVAVGFKALYSLVS